MGFYTTDTLEAAPPRRAPARRACDGVASQRRRARRDPVCSRKPLRGPTRGAISGYRYYSPRMGRWITRDPLAERPLPPHNTQRIEKGVPQEQDQGIFPLLTAMASQGIAGAGDTVVFQAEVELYVFVSNSPILIVDYLGMAPFCVCIRCGTDHCWIHVKDKATSRKTTYGRWKIGYGTPPTTKSGVSVNRELTRSFIAERCQEIANFTPTINPGYGARKNNCVTYARDEWSRLFGVSLYAGRIFHDPAKMVESIQKANDGLNSVNTCCFPWNP